ncbi:ATP-binding protein [uncultured Paracoccus sp.]|uniref:ATP-binding protein n=1 Tax=uncultured Paracoccus sp. TaxID=189685 RepID=UPI0025E1A294|nr:ATP-binding protein [uncultured Paracoccus sp.]
MTRHRWRPPRLATQFALLLLVSLLTINAIAALVLAREGTDFDRAVRVQRDMGRLVALVGTLEDVDRAIGAEIVASSGTGYTRFSIAPDPIIPVGASPLRDIERDIARELPDHQVRVVDPGTVSGRDALLLMSLRLNTGAFAGQWLNTLVYPLPASTAWRQKIGFFVPLAASVLGTMAVALILTRRMTRPLRELAAAALAAGRGDHGVRIAETGARELREVAAAFNRMQRDIADFDAERIRMLAAIGHDLRTPITGLRIRAEMVEDDDTRDAMIRTLDDMTVMANDLLQDARRIHTAETPRATDLSALTAALCRDRGAAFGASDPAVAMIRRVALSRAIGNLIDNALRYAGTAEACVARDGDRIAVTVRDRGPGIDPAILDAVTKPFFRGEASRNAETGGTGLGLAIARTIARAHGGDLSLQNRAGGGLSARITLPASDLGVDQDRDAAL